MELFEGINATSIALLTFAVIAIVRIYTAIVEKDYHTAGKVIVAGAAGAIFAPFVADVVWFIGMLIGFSASGVITTASYFGSRSAVQVDKANVINTETLTEGKTKSSSKSTAKGASYRIG